MVRERCASGELLAALVADEVALLAARLLLRVEIAFVVLEAVVSGHVLVAFFAVEQFLVLGPSMLSGLFLGGEEEVAVAWALESQLAIFAMHLHVGDQALLHQIDLAAYGTLKDFLVQLSMDVHVLKDLFHFRLI